MALNYIWSGFFIVDYLAAVVQWLFMGVSWMARVIAPFFSKIFPGVPKDHPATGHMVMNFSANVLGLDNAATPFGLKATESLQSLNPNKEEASDAQIMFLVLQTSGLTVILLSTMAQRAILGASDPSDVFIPCLIATFCSTLAGIVAVSIRQRIRLWERTVLTWLGSMTLAIVALVVYFTQYLTKDEIELVSKVTSNFILLSIIVVFIGMALKKRVNVYEAFDRRRQGRYSNLAEHHPLSACWWRSAWCAIRASSA